MASLQETFILEPLFLRAYMWSWFEIYVLKTFMYEEDIMVPHSNVGAAAVQQSRRGGSVTLSDCCWNPGTAGARVVEKIPRVIIGRGNQGFPGDVSTLWRLKVQVPVVLLSSSGVWRLSVAERVQRVWRIHLPVPPLPVLQALQRNSVLLW